MMYIIKGVCLVIERVKNAKKKSMEAFVFLLPVFVCWWKVRILVGKVGNEKNPFIQLCMYLTLEF